MFLAPDTMPVELRRVIHSHDAGDAGRSGGSRSVSKHGDAQRSKAGLVHTTRMSSFVKSSQYFVAMKVHSTDPTSTAQGR